MDIVCANDRYEGFRESCGAVFDKSRCFSLMQGKSLCDVLQDLLRSEPQTDGIFCFSDLIAFEVSDILRAAGRTDITVVGYDNIREALHIPYRLASVSSDKRQMAEVAVEVVMHKIGAKGAVRRFNKMHDVFLVAEE